MLLIVKPCIDTIAQKKKAFYIHSYILLFGITFIGRATEEMLEERPLKRV